MLIRLSLTCKKIHFLHEYWWENSNVTCVVHVNVFDRRRSLNNMCMNSVNTRCFPEFIRSVYWMLVLKHLGVVCWIDCWWKTVVIESLWSSVWWITSDQYLRVMFGTTGNIEDVSRLDSRCLDAVGNGCYQMNISFTCCPGECVPETFVPASPGISLLCVWQSSRCQQHFTAMLLHKADGSSGPWGLVSRTSLTQLIMESTSTFDSCCFYPATQAMHQSYLICTNLWCILSNCAD